MKKLIRNILLILISIYVVYVFISQQITINAYQREQARYEQEIEQAQKKQNELNDTKNNIDSPEYIEEIAREKLGMYLPNERVYVDVSK